MRVPVAKHGSSKSGCLSSSHSEQEALFMPISLAETRNAAQKRTFSAQSLSVRIIRHLVHKGSNPSETLPEHQRFWFTLNSTRLKIALECQHIMRGLQTVDISDGLTSVEYSRTGVY